MSFRPPRTRPILSIFHNPACSKSRAALQVLNSHKDPPYQVDIIDYLKDPPTADQLRQVSNYLGTVQGMLRPDAPKVTDISQLITLVNEDPSILERPVVVDWDKGKAVLGRPTSEAVEQLVKDRLAQA
ncbi:thioredoxin-like protein [Umbelopsis sp. PMI_123]|nr:thioredoxin-like protein [Umbelopsis sp. PMI_123]